MDRVIVLDIGAAQFRALFGYLGLYKKMIDNIMEEKKYNIYQAKNELVSRMKNRVIYLSNPDYTFCNMVSGYCNQLKVDMEDLFICAQDYGSWRKEISTVYKSQRRTFLIDKIMECLSVDEEAAKEWIQNQYETFNDLYQKLSESLPFYFIKQYKCEADDVASVCCRYYRDKEIILISTDADWEMLLTFPNVKIWSPVSKKYKIVPNPMKVLLDKIQGDVSDNLLEKPSSELEFEKRKKIVDLISPLPENIENPIKEALNKIMPKNVYLHKVPFPSIRTKFSKIYKTENNDEKN